MVALPPSLTSEDSYSAPSSFVSSSSNHALTYRILFVDVLPAQSQLRDDVLGYMTGMVGLPVGMVAFEDLPDPIGGVSHFRVALTSHTNALSPVMARPTISVFISRVPS